MGSVVKLNHHLAPLQDAPHGGPFHLLPVISRAISERLEKVFPSQANPFFHHHDPVGPAIPGSHQLRARLDPSRQFEPTVRFS
jgi:hypothetical protein